MKNKEKGYNYRITPADAGKTQSRECSMQRDRDHPRGCGENLKRLIFLPEVLGSPPRMRGKLSCGISGGSGAGITPADAGKTS